MKRCAESSEKAMWVDFHWTVHNSFIRPELIGDAAARERFAAAVNTDELSLQLGSWTWTEEEPTPPMSVLSKAPVWNPSYLRLAALREELLQEPLQWEVRNERGLVRSFRPSQGGAQGA